MSICRYSIVPTPGSILTCSRCGEKIEDLPYYSQVAQLYFCILKKGDVSHYVGLGLGAPMCDRCDEQVDETISSTTNRYKYFGWVIAFIIFIIWISLDSSMPGGLLFLLALLGLICVVISNHSNTWKHKSINEKLKYSGLDAVKTPFDYLKRNGWGQVIDGQQTAQDYTEGSLRLDLDKICGGGRFRILDNDTGCFVDHQDSETLKQIYERSLWRYGPRQ